MTAHRVSRPRVLGALIATLALCAVWAASAQAAPIGLVLSASGGALGVQADPNNESGSGGVCAGGSGYEVYGSQSGGYEYSNGGACPYGGGSAVYTDGLAGTPIASTCPAAPQAPGGGASSTGWSPEAPAYCEGETANVPVTMSDGTVLRADVYFPTDPATGRPAPGPFPVILIQTPYGKTAGSYVPPAEGLGPDPYLIQRGYIEAVADIRGTGDSGGSFNLLDPVQATDGVTLVHWAAGLPGADGQVGTLGPSYLGYIQLMTASKVGPDSPLKAIFPIVAGNDIYRDAAFQGGILDGEFDTAYEALMVGVNQGNPVDEDYADPLGLAGVELSHAQGIQDWQLSQSENILQGGDEAYDEAYWQARAPRNMIGQIVANGIPAFLVGGWHDLFQRGELLNYSDFQDAWDGRAVGQPMLADQPVTGRYQLMMGPWYHLTYGQGTDMQRIELAWFDRWLKGEATGIDETSTPLHLYELGSGTWQDAARYPLSEATPTTSYLGGSGALSASAPAAGGGSDTIVYTGASSPCRGSTEQWGTGAGSLAASEAGTSDPCTQDDSSSQAGPGSLTYTGPALSQAETIAGPVDVTLYATSTAADTEWDATLEAVSPAGGSTPLTSGALLGSMRALDGAQTWYAPDGNPLAPFHPYTEASVAAVTPGLVTRYDIEVFPTFAQVPAGDRIRLTLTTSDTPHLLPTPSQQANLAGGVYQVQHTAGAASFVEIPLASPSRFAGCGICG